VLKNDADGQSGKARGVSSRTATPMPHSTSSTPPTFRPSLLASSSVSRPSAVISETTI